MHGPIALFPGYPESTHGIKSPAEREETAADGRYVTDDNIASLNFDAEALKQMYEPAKQGPTGKYFCTIFGRYFRVQVKNVGTKPTDFLRVFVRGSVF